MTKMIILIYGLLFSLTSGADSALSFRTGFDVTSSPKSALFSVAWEETLKGKIFYRIDGGLWSDNQTGHSGSLFTDTMVGLRLGDYNGLNLTPALGILILAYPDAVLGTPFEFTQEVTVGYQCIGLGYKHISNGGLGSPNLGRDYVFMNFIVPVSY